MPDDDSELNSPKDSDSPDQSQPPQPSPIDEVKQGSAGDGRQLFERYQQHKKQVEENLRNRMAALYGQSKTSEAGTENKVQPNEAQNLASSAGSTNPTSQDQEGSQKNTTTNSNIGEIHAS